MSATEGRYEGGLAMSDDAVFRSTHIASGQAAPEAKAKRARGVTQGKRGPEAEAARNAQPSGQSRPQIVLVLQGGGALGAYQAGVYEGLCEGGVMPDWVIGTSIGAINGAIIAGNAVENRLEKLQTFWAGLASRRAFDEAWSATLLGGFFANITTLAQGVPGFFHLNPHAPWGFHLPVGLERASFYTTEPLRRRLGELVDFAHLNAGNTRLTVGAVSVRTGEMRYFDTRHMALEAMHV